MCIAAGKPWKCLAQSQGDTDSKSEWGAGKVWMLILGVVDSSFGLLMETKLKFIKNLVYL